MDFMFVRCRYGLTPQIDEATGSGTIEDGDLLVWSSGAVAKAGNEALKSTLAGVANGDFADGDTVQFYPIDPTAVFRTTIKGAAGNPGTFLQLDVTSGVQRLEAATTRLKSIAQLWKVVDSSPTNDIVDVIFLSLEATAT